MEIHLSLVKFDQALAQECADRAARVISATDFKETLPRVTDDQNSFACKFCPFKGLSESAHIPSNMSHKALKVLRSREGW